MPRRRLHGETQKRRQKVRTAQLKRGGTPHRVEATHAPAPFERAEPPNRQDLEFLEAMRALSVSPNLRRTVPPLRLREVERVLIEEPGEAQADFMEAMERLGVRPLHGNGAPGRAAMGQDARGNAPSRVEPAAESRPSAAPAPRPAPAMRGRSLEPSPTLPKPAPAARATGTAPPAGAPPHGAPQAAPRHRPAPEPTRFDEGGASMAELLQSGFDPRNKYEGAPPSPRPSASLRRPAWARGPDADADPDDQLDLHGKTQEEAIRMVQNFLLRAQKRKLRTVLVITGRGLRSGEHGPVLRDAVRRWLERNGGRYLREFRDAPGKHGGEGAVWIEMK